MSPVGNLRLFLIKSSERAPEHDGCWIPNPGVARSSRAGGASFSREIIEGLAVDLRAVKSRVDRLWYFGLCPRLARSEGRYVLAKTAHHLVNTVFPAVS